MLRLDKYITWDILTERTPVKLSPQNILNQSVTKLPLMPPMLCWPMFWHLLLSSKHSITHTDCLQAQHWTPASMNPSMLGPPYLSQLLSSIPMSCKCSPSKQTTWLISDMQRTTSSSIPAVPTSQMISSPTSYWTNVSTLFMSVTDIMPLTQTPIIPSLSVMSVRNGFSDSPKANRSRSTVKNRFSDPTKVQIGQDR